MSQSHFGALIIILITLTLGESSLSSESSIDLCDIIDGVVGVNGPEFSEVRTEMVPWIGSADATATLKFLCSDWSPGLSLLIPILSDGGFEFG